MCSSATALISYKTVIISLMCSGWVHFRGYRVTALDLQLYSNNGGSASAGLSVEVRRFYLIALFRHILHPRYTCTLRSTFLFFSSSVAVAAHKSAP